MIHYHGGPITPNAAAIQLWTRRHALVSFERPDQMALAAEVCQSFILDNGAFSKWKAEEGEVDVEAYADWVRHWHTHPGYDFCIIPDKIDGTEMENQRMISRWLMQNVKGGIPVWHMHESLGRLQMLMDMTCGMGASSKQGRIALGSSGEYATVGNDKWWARISEAMQVVCDEEGRPKCKLHGLRMLSPTVFSHLPLSSADSCNVARNIGLDQRWRGPYEPVTKGQRALVLAERIEHHVSAARWSRRVGIQQNFELIG